MKPELPPALNLWEFRYENDCTRRADALFSPTFFHWMETAWAVMLMEQGIVPAAHHRQIAATTMEFWKAPIPKNCYFGCLEMYAIEKLGVEIAGSLTIGRTVPSLIQMFEVRQRLLKLLPMLYDLQAALLDAADEYKDAVMPGYTHTRHAQPETLGHYLLSVYDPMARIMAQIEDGYRLMSLNELGCGALAGTSLPIDRDAVTAYLGLEGLIENTNDAVAYSDGYVSLVAALANLVSIWSRIALDFQFWSGEEYEFMFVPWLTAKHAAQREGGKGKSHSHFMPNKVDNSPYLERTRVAAAELAGQLMELVAMGSRTPHSDNHEMLHMSAATVRAIRSTHEYLHVWIYALPYMKVNRARMLEMSRRGYSCASELANRIVLEHGYSYRIAHEIVYELVAEARNRGIPACAVPLEILEAAAVKATGQPLGMSEQKLRQSLDPEYFVQVTNSRGGTSPAECVRMLAARRQDLEAARAAHGRRLDKLEAARARLLAKLAGFAGA